MKKILIIAQWEFFEKVRKKSFLISIIITPLIFLAIGYSTGLLNPVERNNIPVPIGILDFTKQYSNRIIADLSDYYYSDGQPKFIPILLRENPNDRNYYDKDIEDNIIAGYILITKSINNITSFELRTGNQLNNIQIGLINNTLLKSAAIVDAKEYGLGAEGLNKLSENLNIKLVHLKNRSDTEAEMVKAFFTGYIFIMLLLIMIIFAGGMFVRSMVEEKSNRIMEILLSSCKINTLLAGKIIGLSFLGLFQLLIWVIFGYFMQSNDLVSLEAGSTLYLQLAYFILGYMIYTSIFVGLGSIVNSEHDAQQITGNLSLIMIIPIIISTQVIQSPNSLLANLLTFFPLTTAPVMILRLNIYTPPIWEIAASLLILLLSIYLLIFISSKIFKIGILYYGKRPSLKELLSWIKD